MENNYIDVEVDKSEQATHSPQAKPASIQQNSGLNNEYLQSYDAWIRIFIIV
jgi:hypothetical protein